jgi:hypothetical protein
MLCMCAVLCVCCVGIGGGDKTRKKQDKLEARQDKSGREKAIAKHDKRIPGKARARQYNTRQHKFDFRPPRKGKKTKTIQLHKLKQDKTMQDNKKTNTGQDKTRQDKTRQDNTGQERTLCRVFVCAVLYVRYDPALASPLALAAALSPRN